MKQSIKQAMDFINAYCLSRIEDKDFIKRTLIEGSEEYKIPISILNDILTQRETVKLKPNELFVIFKVLQPARIDDFFTEQEIKAWNNELFAVENDINSIELNMIQIAKDQWVGAITVKQLMELRNAHKIRYNENTQRTLKRITKENVDMYQISLNKAAVKGICEAFNDGTYIPNILTFNIPEETEFFYNPKTMKLSIHDLTYIDIIDGYHRYIAMSKLYNQNSEFDYNMEIRLVCFSEEKARQFIWQEDQKTKMKKVDSEFLNQNNSGNQIVESLKEYEPFKGKIGSTIDAPTLAKAVNILYFPKKEKVERKTLVQIRKNIISTAEFLEDKNPDLFDNKWNPKDIFSFVISCIEDRENQDYIFNRLIDSAIEVRGTEKTQFNRLYAYYNKIREVKS